MDFSFRAKIAGPVDRVLVMLRDRLTDLVPFLPTVDAIAEVEREVDGPRVRIVNAWQGNSHGVPTFARPFVTKAMTAWHDRALWDSDARTITWSFEPNRFQKLYTCSGLNYIRELDDGATELEINGSLIIHPEHLPLPGPLARKFAPKITSWAVGKVQPNLMLVPQAIQRFFDSERAAAGT
ncbi:MAG: hypothetical protein CVU56_15015 [Deltaproteobacteria bacterium HGW-Deltaproteobacteria-14]|jgi:hypothetical protein|nr:MAG: hypothetical protein CVU56_15015 [Deltaproteobacteria bacterium HGW-Deltaproteobacteria-14]